jgi:uncharacterized protein (TIGR04255 family)
MPYQPFPESNRVIFERNPIAQVICQVRFPTILEIQAADPAAFQNRVREVYPVYELDSGSAFPQEIADIVARLPIAPSPDRHNHVFQTADGNRAITLGAGFLSLTEQQYVRWEDFRSALETAKEALEAVYHPSFYSRIGLRYIDVVDKSALELSDPWDELINPQFIGLLGTDVFRERIKDIKGVSLIALDDSIPGASVRVRHGLIRAEDGAESYHIDADYFTEERRVADDVVETLDEFNRLAGHFFRWAITPRLQNALHPKPLD